MAVGLTMIGVGLFKKVAIADNLALYASPVFAATDAGDSLSMATVWSGGLRAQTDAR
tara:strand:- start:13506 stop:13676 length:171 start_codon:yes stop_codon:yes gene_type:complete